MSSAPLEISMFIKGIWFEEDKNIGFYVQIRLSLLSSEL